MTVDEFELLSSSKTIEKTYVSFILIFNRIDLFQHEKVREQKESF